MSLETPKIAPAISSAQLLIYSGIREVSNMMEKTSKTVKPITEDLAKKQLEKGANSMTKMLASITKISLYAYLVEELMNIWNAFFIQIKPLIPFLKITAAIITAFYSQPTAEMVKFLSDAYSWYAKLIPIAKEWGVTAEKQAEFIHNVNLITTGWIITLFELWKILYDINYILVGASVVPAFQSLYDIFELILSPLTDLRDLIEDIGDYIDDLPSLPGGDNGDGGDRCDDPVYALTHPFECLGIGSAQHGMYTGSYQGLINVHPDEYIIPGDKMRGSEVTQYTIDNVVETLETLVRQNRRAERRKRFKK